MCISEIKNIAISHPNVYCCDPKRCILGIRMFIFAIKNVALGLTECVFLAVETVVFSYQKMYFGD